MISNSNSIDSGPKLVMNSNSNALPTSCNSGSSRASLWWTSQVAHSRMGSAVKWKSRWHKDVLKGLRGVRTVRNSKNMNSNLLVKSQLVDNSNSNSNGIWRKVNSQEFKFEFEWVGKVRSFEFTCRRESTLRKVGGKVGFVMTPYIHSKGFMAIHVC